MAAGADIAHQPLHALVLLGFLRQCREHDITRKLPHEIRSGVKDEALLAHRRNVHLGFAGFEAYRLRPHPVFAGRQRREVVIAARVCEHSGRHGSARGLRRNGYSAQLFTGRRCDGAAEDDVLGGRDRADRGQHGQGDEETACALHDGVSDCTSTQRWAPAEVGAPGMVLRYATIASICVASK